MLQAADSQTANILKRRIQELTPIVRMIVFGSRARGNATDESDLDVFLEISYLTSALRKQIFDIAWEIGLEREVVISVFLTSTEMLVDSPLTGNPILLPIFREGIPV